MSTTENSNNEKSADDPVSAYHGSDELESYVGEELVGGKQITRALSQTAADEETGPPSLQRTESESLKRTGSRMSIRSAAGFFSGRVKQERHTVFRQYITNWVVLCVGVLLILSIYWGSFYERSKRYHNLKFLVVNEDDLVINGVQPVFGTFFNAALNSEQVKFYGNFEHNFNTASFIEKYKKENVTAEINHLIHHEKFWAAIHIKKNFTSDLFTALKNSDSSFNINDPEHSIDIVYETGRDFLNIPSQILPQIRAVANIILSPENILTKLYSPLVANLTTEEKSNVISNAAQLLLNIPTATYVDNLPQTNALITAPSQVGMIYLIILTFFQFNFFASTHMILAKKVKPSHFVLYRILSSQISYFFVSLFYSWVSLAFQVDFSRTYGRSGFLVFWMTCYLTMAAVGGANENMALVSILVYPPLLGFWLLFWVISNVSPTFSPMALLSPFYRYGYAFPIHNAGEIFKVILCNASKDQIGRNYGILVAWIVINNALFPFILKFFAKTQAKKAAAAAAAGKP